MLAPRSDVTIDEAERLIYLEAELLDEWRLDDWLKLYTGDMTYLVPTPGMPLTSSATVIASGLTAWATRLASWR